MPQISFLSPLALLLLALIPLLWVPALAAPRRTARWRQVASLALRTVIMLALILGIAGAQLTFPASAITTIFLLDRSDSVGDSQRAQQEQYVEQALQRQRPGDRTGIVVFGRNALVEHAPGDLAALGRLASAPMGTRTSLPDAIQLGMALFPNDTQKRLVLISDGGNNLGTVGEAAQLARLGKIPIDVVNLPADAGQDVLVRRIDTPGSARLGQEIGVTAQIESSYATRGTVQVFVDGELALSQEREIPQGQSSISFQLPAGAAGYRKIDVQVQAQGDATSQNNRTATFTEIKGPPKLLIVAAEPDKAESLRAALEAGGAQPVVSDPSSAPTELAQLSEYAAVILFDTRARDLPHALMENIPTYVRELGGGFAMVGGQHSFGAGGYRRTAIAPILPVELDPIDTMMRPDVALTMVIDHSGSMAEASGSGSRTKLDLAKEAVYQASLGLTPQDQIGLVVFDDMARWVLPLQKMPDTTAIEQALGTFDPDGGTDILPGMQLAAGAMEQSQAKIKHVILLTDGLADDNYAQLVQQMNAQGVTISTVALGDDANPNLEGIAKQGGGRYYQVRSAQQIPNIFLQETVIIAGRDLIDRDFTPMLALSSAALRGITSFPTLRGYNGTELKSSARTILVTDDSKPLLAQEQVGLGRTVAWASDLDGRWSAQLLRWDAFPRFMAGFIDMLVPPQGDTGLTLEASAQGDQVVLTARAQDASGQPVPNLAVSGNLLAPQDQQSQSQQGQKLTFTQVGAGEYRATAPAHDIGVYLAQVAAVDAQGAPAGTAKGGVVMSYSPEYGQQRANPSLLADIARATAGRVDPPADTAYERLAQPFGAVYELGLTLLLLALALLPLDIAVRRVFIPLRSLVPARQRAAAPQPIPAMARLGQAKQRAQARVAAPEPPQAAAPEPRPAPQAAPRPAPPKPAPKPQGGAAMSDEQFARLLAAKKRARDSEKQ